MADLPSQIEELWSRVAELSPADTDALGIVTQAVELLDRGKARVAELDPVSGEVVVHSWLKTAILLLFRLRAMETTEVGPYEFHDKLPLKTGYAAAGVRVVPGASARWGSFLDRGVILMPSYVNIGARVGADTMVDTWATVGSCAQIGRASISPEAWASAACSSRPTRRRSWWETTPTSRAAACLPRGPAWGRGPCWPRV